MARSLVFAAFLLFVASNALAQDDPQVVTPHGIIDLKESDLLGAASNCAKAVCRDLIVGIIDMRRRTHHACSQAAAALDEPVRGKFSALCREIMAKQDELSDQILDLDPTYSSADERK